MGSPKGEVTPFASLFPVDDANKAVKRVEDAIAGKHKEMGYVKEFIADNNTVINLVSKLPEELHHDIMVPFGKAAFFPGQLIHTNEFVEFFEVLLGEGYYAERTSKQTVDILKRRGKALDSQVESLKANIKDLQAEASFFDATASEAAEGIVEIRENYVEEDPGEEQFKPAFKGKGKSSEPDENKEVIEDDEYARMMARLDELEKEEEELADEDEDDDEDENTEDGPMANAGSEDANEEEEEEEEEEKEEEEEEEDEEEDDDEQSSTSSAQGDVVDPDSEDGQIARYRDQLLYQTLSERKQPGHERIEDATVGELSNKYQSNSSLNDEQNCIGLTVQPLPKGVLHNETGSVPHRVKDEAMSSAAEHVSTGSIVERSNNRQTNSQTAYSSSFFPGSKAFNHTIVERSTEALDSATSQAPSKPVSRFMMQRRR